MKRIAFIVALLSSSLWAQITTTITGTIKDLTNTIVTSGKVTFTLTPNRDTTISGIARFTPTTVTCLINASGLIKAQDGTSTCTVMSNTALSPAGTYYTVAVWPYNVKTSSFNFYAVLSTYDWSTVVPTPATAPALTFATGTTSLTNPGVFTNTQQNNNFFSAVGGIDPTAWFTQQGGNHSSDAIAGGLNCLVSSTVHQCDGVAGYVSNLCNSLSAAVCNSVALYGSSGANANGSSNWGINTVTYSGAATTGTWQLNEFDTNVTTGAAPTLVTGLQFNGVGAGTMPSAYPVNSTTLAGAAVIDIWSPFLTVGGSAYQWPLGINFRRAAINGTAIQIDGPCRTGSCNSNPETLTAYAANVPVTSSFFASQKGETQFSSTGTGVGVGLPNYTFAQLNAAATNGTMLYCTDCKNVVDNAATAGAACANAGSGAFAKRENGRWDCN